MIVSFAAEASAKKKTSFIPSGVEIYEHVYMRDTEVTNFDYLEYLSYMKSKVAHDEYLSLLPDTTVWRTEYSYNEPFVEYYFRHPAYRDYPIVGLTKIQVEQYCYWLSMILTENNRNNADSNIDSVLVRLPTDTEWTWAAKGGHDYYEYPWEGHNLRMEDKKFQGMIRANFVRGKGDYMGLAGALNDNADITAPVRSYWPNDFGLYNCAGNVAEMVADRDVAKGGSWYSSGYDIRVNSEIPFTKPSSQIGFRYLVEVKRLKGEEVKSPLRLDKKWFKHNFIQMGDSIMFQKFEVNNELYNLFLSETGHQKQDTTLWNEHFPYSDFYSNNYRWHTKYRNYPAVGMTRQDVIVFCQWLSAKLSGFIAEGHSAMLPDEKEWIDAARGGLELSPYPWGGPYIRNSKGCLLANHKYVPESFSTRSRDGEWQTSYPEGRHNMYGADFDGKMGAASVDSYLPNGFGLFNMAGNIREMISEQHLTKGGGWKSLDHYLQVSSREEWDEDASAEVGFRVVIRK